MSIQGLYQNNVPGLAKLKLQHYERIFKVFDIESADKKFFFYNILRKIEFPDNIDPNIIKYHNMEISKPLTTISYDIYGDLRLWWLIFLLNKAVIGSNLFIIPAGVQLKFIKPEFLETVFIQITNLSILNGRHY